MLPSLRRHRDAQPKPLSYVQLVDLDSVRIALIMAGCVLLQAACVVTSCLSSGALDSGLQQRLNLALEGILSLATASTFRPAALLNACRGLTACLHPSAPWRAASACEAWSAFLERPSVATGIRAATAAAQLAGNTTGQVALQVGSRVGQVGIPPGFIAQPMLRMQALHPPGRAA